MDRSSPVSASVAFLLSTSLLMFVSAYRRSLLSARLKPTIVSNSKKLTTSSSPTQHIPSVTSSPNTACGTDEGGCDACSEKVNDMLGSVKAYDRHVILCVPPNSVWERDISFQSDVFPYNLVKHIEICEKEIKRKNVQEAAVVTGSTKPCKLKLTAMLNSEEDQGDDENETVKVVVYPDNLMFRLGKEQLSDFASFVLQPTPLKQSSELHQYNSCTPPWNKLVLVCVHNARDKRCGRAGPQVITELESLLSKKKQEQRQQQQQQAEQNFDSDLSIAVRGSSHIGGHQYAGTLIVCPEGRWYGRITKSNTAELLEHVIHGTVFSKCERGITSSKLLQW